MIYYGKGFSVDNEMFDMAVEFNIIEKAGGWLEIKLKKLGKKTMVNI